MIAVGQKVLFDPFAWIDGSGSEDYKGEKVVGTVVMVNCKHGWFSVEYGYPVARTSFNFCDIGTVVTICG